MITIDHEVEELKGLLLDIAYERSVQVLLNTIVNRLSQLPDIALSRIWLLQKSDLCPSCYRRDACIDQTRCLHLCASAGHSITGRTEEWSRTDSPFRRAPFGILRVGHIAKTQEPLILPTVTEGLPLPSGIDSFKHEKIIGFSGQPLLYKGETIGVLALFTRKPPKPERVSWLRMIADHAAIAVVNARAFQKIEELKSHLEQENAYLQEELSGVYEIDHIVGKSNAIQSVLDQIKIIAPTDANILITGESGTGKEVIARGIYKKSRRKGNPFVKVNCAAIPRDLFESEFFGHTKGAFTGAIKDREGRFSLADGGTLLLDEVGEIPLNLQSKLLRVLQEGSYERVGEEITRKVDVRIIASSNQNLKTAMENGRFRQDLFYRLNVIPIHLPPLKERQEDIPLLVTHFLKMFSKRMNRPLIPISKEDLDALAEYEWPGNVRELLNCVERTVILSQTGVLDFDFPPAPRVSAPEKKLTTDWENRVTDTIFTESELKQMERDNTLAALDKCRGRVYGPTGAARLLDIKPTTLASRIKKFGLHRQYQ